MRITTYDGLRLEAELAPAAGVTVAAAVLCHPHPQYGGTMRSIVVSALFEALPAAGITCLRFNFRGVEFSEGSHNGGRGEREDVGAAVSTLDADIPPQLPLWLVGWSFGADMALGVHDARLAGWVAIAPPLHYGDTIGDVGADPRCKRLVLAEHDEFQAPEAVREKTAEWTNTVIDVVGGASHFFVGRTDRVVELARAQIVSAADSNP
jgi:alpha/beta superfamily hydrolase